MMLIFLDKSSADLVWVNYETRLRKLMQELLQPTVKRSREDREMYDSLVKKYDFLHKRVETLEFVTNKTDNQQTIFDDIFMKITNLVKVLRGLYNLPPILGY